MGGLAELLQGGVDGQDSFGGAKDRGVAAPGAVRGHGNEAGEVGVQLDRHQVGAGPAGTEEGAAVEHAEDAGAPGRGGRRAGALQVREDEDIGDGVPVGQRQQLPGVGSAKDADNDAGSGVVLTRR